MWEAANPKKKNGESIDEIIVLIASSTFKLS